MAKQDFVVGALKASAGEKVQTFLQVEGTPVKMPITLINGIGEGKTVVITGGTHGGEYPGIETAIRIAKNIDPKDVNGQIAIIHPVNVPAFLAKTQYVSPLDGKNLNREYPGIATGTVTQRVAYTISSLLFSQADFYMDLHGGDIHEALVPFVIYSKLGTTPEQTELAIAASKATGIKYVSGSTSSNGTFGYAATIGVPGFLAEIGNLGLWSEEEVQTYVNGVENVLRFLDVLSGDAWESKDSVMLDHMEGLDATDTGCWYPCVQLDQPIKAGDKVGEVRDFFGNVLSEYFCPCDGVVLYIIASLAINAGDPIFCVGKY